MSVRCAVIVSELTYARINSLSNNLIPISNETMRSSLVARLILIGCILFPEAALGRLVPVYVWREFPTSSPTSTPSYQPSVRPSSEPTLQPSLAPSTSMKPSHRPSSSPSSSPSYQPSLSTQPTSQVTSTLLRASNLEDSDRMAEPSSRGLVLIVSIVSAIAILLCFVCIGFQRYRQSKCVKYDDDQESQTSSDGDQESQSDQESQNSVVEEDESASMASSAKTNNIDEAHVNDDLNISNIGYALTTRFQRAIDTLTTRNRHVHFDSKKKVQVFHIAEEPGMITYDSGPEDNSNEPPAPILRPPTPTLPSTPVPRRPPTPILRPSTPRPATPTLR